MTLAEDIQQLISAGRFEYSLERSNQYLKNAVELARESAKMSHMNYLISLLAKEAYKELALNEARPSARTALWSKALGALEWCNPTENDQYASNYAELAVDVCQDPFSDMSNSRRHQLLKHAKVLVDNSIPLYRTKIRIADIVDKYGVLAPSAHSRVASRLRAVLLAYLAD